MEVSSPDDFRIGICREIVGGRGARVVLHFCRISTRLACTFSGLQLCPNRPDVPTPNKEFQIPMAHFWKLKKEVVHRPTRDGDNLQNHQWEMGPFGTAI